MSSTLRLPVNIFTWNKKKPCLPEATKIFVPRARIELATFRILDRTFQPLNHQGSSVSEVGILLYQQGAECIALLCSVSRVASASFSKVIFNDVLVSSTLTLPVNIFTWKKEKPCSSGARQLIQGKTPTPSFCSWGNNRKQRRWQTIMLESTKHYSRLENSNSELSNLSETTIISNIPKKIITIRKDSEERSWRVLSALVFFCR